jgi:hypothetical protein
VAATFLFGTIGAMVLGASPASAASTLTCTNTVYGGTYSSVTVPAGASCALIGVTVKGDVKAKNAKDLDIFDSLIKGNLFIQGSTGSNTFEVSCSTISKSVDVANLQGAIELEGDPKESCDTVTVGGSVNVHDNHFAEVSYTKIGGSLNAAHNGEVELENNNISGDRTCGNNGTLDINDEPDTVHGADNCTS